MRTTVLRFVFLVTLVIILTSAMTTASTDSEYFSIKGTSNGIADTSSIELADVYYGDTTGYAYDVFVSGDYAYLAVQAAGLAVIDVSDPTNPGAPVYETTTGYAMDIFVSGDYAYLAVQAAGLAVIDISDPTNPSTPVYKDTTGYAMDIFVSGDYAYVAVRDSGLAVIDISDPTNPGTPVYVDTTGYAMDIFVSGDYAYLADYDSGLAVIDVSDPTNPGAPVYVDTTGFAYGVYVSGYYAYVADAHEGLAVIDISDPTNPRAPVYVDTTIAQGVFVSEDYAYVAVEFAGLAVIDVSHPTNPGAPVYEDTTGDAQSVFVSGNYSYIAAGNSGLAVIQMTTEASATMLILVIGGGSAVIALIAVLFIVRIRKQEGPTSTLPPTPSPDETEASILEEAAEALHVAPAVDEEALKYETMEEPLVIEEVGVQALRGAEFVGNRLRFKVKVLNNTANVITDVTVTLSSYPRDSLNLEGDVSRAVPKIDPMGFRSPSFEFLPTEDCVRGTVVASVSYVDHRGKTHIMTTQPYTIRAVCDLLTPESISPKDFNLKLIDFDHGEITLRVEEWTPEEMQSKTQRILDTSNFFEVSSKTENVGNHIELRVTGWAKGKYTGKNIGVEITVTGQPGVRGATCKIRMSGEDDAMIMPAIDEIGKKLSAWLCPMCGGRLPVESVGDLKAGRSIACPFCGVTIDR